MLTVILIALAMQQLLAGSTPPGGGGEEPRQQGCHESRAVADLANEPYGHPLSGPSAGAWCGAGQSERTFPASPSTASSETSPASPTSQPSSPWVFSQLPPAAHDAPVSQAAAAAGWRIPWPRFSEWPVTLLSPVVWYSGPGGVTGAVRVRSTRPGVLDRMELGIAASARVPSEGRDKPPASPPGTGASPSTSRWQGWVVREDPIQPGATRPGDGVSFGVYRLDGLWRLDARREWYLLRPQAGGRRARLSLGVTGTYPYDHNFYPDDRWSGRAVTDVSFGIHLEPPDEQGIRIEAMITGGYVTGRGLEDEPFLRTEASARLLRRSPTGHLVHFIRLYIGGEIDAPVERGVYASALSPTQSFANHLLRPHKAPLSVPEVRYIPTGGAAMRGYDPRIRVPNLAAVNLEEAMRLHAFGVDRRLELFATAFADVGVQILPDTLADGSDDSLIADAGVGVALRGPLLQRDVRMRLDFPLWVSRPELAYSWTSGRERPAAMRVSFSFTDLW